MARRSPTESDAVVVPADHGGSSLACVRSLGRRGVDVLGVASTADAPPLASKHCRETHLAPSPGEDLAGYRDVLLDLATRPDVRTVLPLYEPDIHVLATDRAAFADHVGTPWVDGDRLERARDRRRLLERAADAGVDVPEFGLLAEWDDWESRTVVKPRYTMQVRDGGVRYGPVGVQEPGESPDAAAVREAMGHDPLVQSYVPSAGEYGFFALYDDGDPVVTFQHRRVRSYSYAGGASVYREAVDVPALRTAGRRTLDALDWHGPAMAEFRRDARDGSFRLLEVNPRFWGSLPLAVTAGVDFPGQYYRLAGGQLDDVGPPDGRNDYDLGAGCHKLRGEASYLYSVFRDEYDHVERPSPTRSVATVLASVVAERNFDFLSAADPAPFVRDVRNRVPIAGGA